MKYFLSLLLLLSSFAGLAQVQVLEMESETIKPRFPKEAWVKLTCLGSLTPVSSPLGDQIGPVATYFVQANLNEPFPSLFDLRSRYNKFFHRITSHCQETRMAKVNLTGFTGLWLDWGTDTGYTRLEVGEEFIYGPQCRAVGKPCGSSKQCCNLNAKIPRGSLVPYCDSNTNSCQTRRLEIFDVSMEKK